MGFKRLEEETNMFALCFLMPERNFEIMANKHTYNGKCNIDKVADEFGVEAEKVYERGQMLGFWE